MDKVITIVGLSVSALWLGVLALSALLPRF